MENGWRKGWDMIKEIIFFLIVTVCAYAWWMLILLIISFVTLSVLHFTIEAIYIMAGVGMVCTDIYYVVRRVKEYRKNAK